MLFNDKKLKKSSPYVIHDGYSLWLVRVPFGVGLKTNGEVVSACSAPHSDEYVEWLVEKALNRLEEGSDCSNCGRPIK